MAALRATRRLPFFNPCYDGSAALSRYSVKSRSDQARDRVGSSLADPNRKVMVLAAARLNPRPDQVREDLAAARRLPLGEPPLVITTHAITSFRSSLPGPAGDQPRAGAGSSPSRHGHATRKSVDTCVLSRPTKLMYPPATPGSTGQLEKTQTPRIG